jgi:hypothetical protein
MCVRVSERGARRSQIETISSPPPAAAVCSFRQKNVFATAARAVLPNKQVILPRFN